MYLSLAALAFLLPSHQSIRIRLDDSWPCWLSYDHIKTVTAHLCVLVSGGEGLLRAGWGQFAGSCKKRGMLDTAAPIGELH